MKIETPSQDYLQAFREAADRAAGSMADEVYDAISVPQLMFLTEDYWASPVRVMVLGQETRGEYDGLKDEIMLGHDWFAGHLTKKTKEFVDFNFAIGKTSENTPFWRGLQDVVEAFDLSGRPAVAWSNLVKVQLTKSFKGSFSISKLDPKSRMQVVRWQRELALAEVAYARPDVIVMLTGDLTWVARHVYKAPGNDVRVRRIDGLTASSGHIEADPLAKAVTVFTYHPGALRKGADKIRVADHRKQVLAWAKDRLASAR